MGIAAYNRGTIALMRPFEEAAEHDRWVETCIRTVVKVDEADNYCRRLNSMLAEVSSSKGLRYVFAQPNLAGHIGQLRLKKYLHACNVWREASAQQRVWMASLAKQKAGKALASWLGIDP